MFIDVILVILPKLIYRFNIILFKIPTDLFEEIDNLILKYIWKFKGPKIVETILKMKNKAIKLTLTNFKI